MIETARGLAALDEICAVPGLTGVYVGPADLAISMGHRPAAAWTDPDVRDGDGRDPDHGRRGRTGHRHPRAGTGTIGKAMAEMGFRMITTDIGIAGAAPRSGRPPERGAVTTQPVALVTGAARGQGEAIVARLHADGFRVAACDLLVDELHSSTAQYG